VPIVYACQRGQIGVTDAVVTVIESLDALVGVVSENGK